MIPALAIGFLLIMLPLSASAKAPECRYTSNRLHYARCVNKTLEKRPTKRYLLHRNMETPCIKKEGLEQAECMRVQARKRRIDQDDAREACYGLDGIAQRQCMKNELVIETQDGH